jgi:hypothetical protein
MTIESILITSTADFVVFARKMATIKVILYRITIILTLSKTLNNNEDG